jgi:hypothetical protein
VIFVELGSRWRCTEAVPSPVYVIADPNSLKSHDRATGVGVMEKGDRSYRNSKLIFIIEIRKKQKRKVEAQRPSVSHSSYLELDSLPAPTPQRLQLHRTPHVARARPCPARSCRVPASSRSCRDAETRTSLASEFRLDSLARSRLSARDAPPANGPRPETRRDRTATYSRNVGRRRRRPQNTRLDCTQTAVQTVSPFRRFSFSCEVSHLPHCASACSHG